MIEDHDPLAVTRLVIDLFGADDFARAERHYGRNETLADIAGDAGLSTSSVHRRVVKVYGKLAAHGLLPRHWTRQQPGRPRGRVQHFAEVFPSTRDEPGN